MMNREQLRSVQHLPAKQFYQVISNVVNEEVEKQRNYTFYNLAASMFTALRERFPALMTGDMLHSVAVDTIRIANGIETPAELAARLKEDTGFDIYLPPSEEATLRYIKPEEDERAVSLDTFLRWTERDEHGEPVECCGTVEDLLSSVRTMDGQKIVAEEMDDD